jgi:hypothetical protein
MGEREDTEKMPFESLDATFRGVRPFLVRWDGVVYDAELRSFVVKDLNFEVMAELTK